MTKLDCNVVSCAHNENECCRLREINIEGATAVKAEGTSCGDFRVKGTDYARSDAACGCKDTEVSCKAEECKYNDHKRCSARHIGIAGGYACECSQTECASFEC